MSREENLIRDMHSILSEASRRRKDRAAVFTADAESFMIEKPCRMLSNIDEFSGEDCFREDSAYNLGWNTAAGAISDIHASGGHVRFLSHALTISSKWSRDYCLDFVRGTADVLRECGADFLGGDFGIADEWRCCVSVIGVAEERHVLRNGGKPGDILYTSSPFGAGNLEAYIQHFGGTSLSIRAAGLWHLHIPLRTETAKLIARYASAAIDSSDGGYNAVDMLARQSGTGFMLKDIPIIRPGRWAARIKKIPELLLFFGEAGEFELVFAVPPEQDRNFRRDAEHHDCPFIRIGVLADPGTKQLDYKGHSYDMSTFEIRGRDYADRAVYLRRLADWLNG
ncbi:AIR synthase related protein [Spirochaeta dissipatitropha]